MSGRGLETDARLRTKRRASHRRQLAVGVAALLAVAGCSPGPSSPGGPTTTAPVTSSAAPKSAGTPSKVYSDQELMAIINAVAKKRQLPGTAMDSQRMRSAASGGSLPGVETATTPAECAVFASQNPFTRWADRSVNMADGAMPIAGLQQSGPTTTIMLTLRSA